jgi:hypothetical protein
MTALVQAEHREPTRPTAAARTPLVQRMCACGGTPGPDGECVACKAKRLGIQRRATGASGPALAPPIVHAALSGPGQPLDAGARAALEPRLGHDFGRVRVHADAMAAESARAVNAAAFTVGRQIVFAAGRYAPGTAEGRRLLAHELAHVAQQGDARPVDGQPLAVDHPDSAHERAAEQAAAAATGGLEAPRPAPAALSVQRACSDRLAAVPAQASDSVLNGQAIVNLGSAAITSDITVSPLAGRFFVKMIVPNELQRQLLPGFLGSMRFNVDLSASLSSAPGSTPPQQVGANELCILVTFRRGGADEGGTAGWFVDLRILRGGRLDAPLHIGLGSPLQAPAAGLGTGMGRISLNLADDLTASVGPLVIEGADGVAAAWERIRSQVRDTLELQLRNVQIPLQLRARASLTVPVPFGEDAANGTIVPLNVLGDVQLATEVSSEAGGYRLRLVTQGSGSALGGAVALELFGRGSLRGPLPSTVRLGDLNQEFVQNLLREGEGGGEIRGRLNVFGLRGRVDADFQVRGGQITGNASLLSPLALGAGTFNYRFDEGLRANFGLLGLTRLTIAPAEQRIADLSLRPTGPPSFDLGTSVTGLGATGVRITPTTTQLLSVGVGPQFATAPSGDSVTGVYGGLQYLIQF